MVDQRTQSVGVCRRLNAHALPAAACLLVALSGGAAWAQSFQGLGVPAGATASHATAISGDGMVVVGYFQTPAGERGFRWTQGGGMEELPMLPGWEGARASGISRDGLVVVGRGGSAAAPVAVRWDMTGTPVAQELGVLAGHERSEALAVSADGTVIVGSSGSGSPFAVAAFRWSASTGMEAIAVNAIARGVSADGEVVAGSRFDYGFYWTRSTGAVTLPPTGPHTGHEARLVSDDGLTIIGSSFGMFDPCGVFEWRRSGTGFDFDWIIGCYVPIAMTGDASIIAGVRHSPVPQATIGHRSGIMFDLVHALEVGPGWQLREATAVSTDGLTVAGWGTHNGMDEAWIGSLQRRNFCYANCDNSSVEPILNVDDFTCFINEFAHGISLPYEERWMHYANCDGSNVPPPLSIDDFTCFINEFAAGCP